MKFPGALWMVSIFTLVASDLEVTTWGPTMIPGLKRTQGWLLEKCPSDFPYPFNDGKKCCRSIMKEGDTGLAADCDGGKIRVHSSEACCWKQMYIDCPDQVNGCNKAAETCNPKPIVSDSDQTYGDDLANYGPDHTLTFTQCESAPMTYHLAPNSKTGHWLVYDFGCEVAVEQVLLRNTRNRGHNDRSTDKFSVEISYDMNNWSVLLSGETLQSALSTDVCQIPLHTFDLHAHGRYFRLTLDSYHGVGSGLNYITWKFMT